MKEMLLFSMNCGLEVGLKGYCDFKEALEVPGNDSCTNRCKPVFKTEKQRTIILYSCLLVDLDNDYENRVHVLNFSCKLEKSNEILIVVVTYKGL